jgi:uncharacterized damage-inducible protein DinB
MIQSLDAFTHYFGSIRRRTITYIQTIPADHIDWAPKAGEFTFADLVRHIAAGEGMFVGAVVAGRWHYTGHDQPKLDSLPALLAHLETHHEAAMRDLSNIDDAVLTQDRPALKGTMIKGWRLLMAMIEHEVHHRSQLAMYLTLIGVTPPQIYGLTVEEVIALATG